MLPQIINALTANRVRSAIAPSTLKAATKNPIITIMNSNSNNINDDSSSSSSVYERALQDEILSKPENRDWLTQIELFRQYHGLPRSKLLSSSSSSSNNSQLQLTKHWWLHCAPFIHPSFWSPSAAPILKNQFSMIPLQSYGDSVISLTLSTIDFTLVSSSTAAEYYEHYFSNNKSSSSSLSNEEKLRIGKELVKRDREAVKRGLQDAEFICKKIVMADADDNDANFDDENNSSNNNSPRKRRRVISTPKSNKKIVIPSWSEDLLLMMEKPEQKQKQTLKNPMSIMSPSSSNNNTFDSEADEEYRALKEEAAVGSFIAFIGSVSVEFGVDTASKLLLKLASTSK